MLYKTIAQPDKGINNNQRPYLIDPREWLTLNRFRCKNGVVRNYPGTQTIFAGGTSLAGGYCTLADQFTRFDNATFLILAGPTKVYQYVPASKTLIDLSGATVFGATRDDPWVPFFYQNVHYIINKVDGLYSWNTVGNYTAVPNAPKARAAGVLQDHIIAFNYNDGVDHPQGIKWCSQGQVTVWTPTVTNDAGSFDLDDNADVGVAMQPLFQDMILYKTRTIIPLVWVGGTVVFARRQAISGVGLLGPYALADTGDEHFIMSSDTIYRYGGGTDIDEVFSRRIRDVVYNSMNVNIRNRCRVLFVEEAREILFLYPSASAANDCDTCIGYNIDDDIWFGPFVISQAVSMTGFTNTAQLLTVDQVPDITDTVSTIVDQYGSSIGTPMNLLATGSGGDVWQILESTQSENGSVLTRTMQSGDHFLGKEGMDEFGNPVNLSVDTVFQVQAVNIEVGQLQSGTVTVQLGSKMSENAPTTLTAPVTVTLTPSSFKIRVPFRAIGRWFNILITAANSVSFELGAYQFEYLPVGRR